MSDVPGIREVKTSRPAYVDQLAEIAKGLNVNEKGSALVKEVVGLLNSDRSLRVTNAPVNNTEVGKPIGATGTPCIDRPDSEQNKEQNLEALLGFLQLDNDERQVAFAQKRLEDQKSSLDMHHADKMKKLNKSLEEMDKAAKANLLSKIFGWLGAIVSVIVAVASCIATGGIAVGAVVGAAVALTTCILNETGTIEKGVKALADAMKKAGLSDRASQILAQLTFALGPMLVAGTASFASIKNIANIGKMAGDLANGASKFAKASAAIAKYLPKIARITGVQMGLIGAAVGINSSFANYDANKTHAKLTEMDKFFAILDQYMDETQEEIEKLLEQLEANCAAIMALLNSEIDAEKEIAGKLGQMA
ncbi:MAG: type III secretion system translocon subunit SctE [Lentisphaeria bacterium]|nr:type III secretion system translocon subunit SctE [Lentisphaeria bacterium]